MVYINMWMIVEEYRSNFKCQLHPDKQDGQKYLLLQFTTELCVCHSFPHASRSAQLSLELHTMWTETALNYFLHYIFILLGCYAA